MLEDVHAYVLMSREHQPNLPLNWGRSVEESWEFKKPGGFCNENVTLIKLELCLRASVCDPS